MQSVFGRAAALIAVGCAAGFGVNAARSDGVRLGSFEAPTTCSATGPANVVSPVQVLAPTSVFKLCGDPDALIADARPAERFAAGHVAHAVHLPCGATNDVAERALALAFGKNAVVVYGDTTEEAQPVASAVRERLPDPTTRVIVIEGGFPAWDKAGLACSTGPCPDCNGAAHQ